MQGLRLERALDLLADALEHDPADRESFVAQACAGDGALCAEVLALIMHEQGARSFLETPAFVLNDEQSGDVQGELQPGDVLGECTVIRLLGEGGMGEVYLADDNKLERRVAVKLLKRHLGNDNVLRRFRHERKVLAGLTHPNIARLYGGGITPEGRSWLAMEYVEGERLDRYCDARGLDVPARLSLFRKVCAAVAYAHQNLVVHRDLKPANILVTAEGEPKLLDFGIAKLLDPDATAGTDLTVTMHGAMTPEYASPEQLKGAPITTATDVYSLGGILYELLAGRRPFQAAHARPDLLVRAICEEEPERPSSACGRTTRTDAGRIGGMSPGKLRHCLAGDLDNIVAKAMRKDPARRYASVAQFAEDLRRYGDGLPVTARPDTFAYRTGKFVRRNKLGVALALLVLLTLVAGLIATAWEGRRAARRFEDVRRLAKSMLFEIEPRLASVVGTTSARSLLAQRALEYLDGLSLEAGNDRELRRELAASYERVGDVQGNPAGANLGDLKGGLVSYEKARVIRRALVAGSPSDAWARHELANNLEQTGTFLWWNGDTRSALVNYREASALRRVLLVEQPRAVEFRRGFASVQLRLADVDTWNTQNARALDHLQEALSMLRQLLAEQPRDAAVQIDVARCLARIGVAHREEGDYAAAFDALHRGEAILELLVSREPDNRLALVQYSFELTMENEAYNEQNTPEATANALALSPRVLAIMETLASKDAADTTIQHNVSIAYFDFGTALLHAGRWQEALDKMQKGLSIEERFATRSPDNSEYMHSRGYFHTGMGEARLNLGQLEPAAEDAETARQCTESVVAKDPDDAQAKRDLVTILILRGRIQEKCHRPAEARQSFQQALAALNALAVKKITGHDDAEESKFLREALADDKTH